MLDWCAVLPMYAVTACNTRVLHINLQYLSWCMQHDWGTAVVRSSPDHSVAGWVMERARQLRRPTRNGDCVAWPCSYDCCRHWVYRKQTNCVTKIFILSEKFRQKIQNLRLTKSPFEGNLGTQLKFEHSRKSAAVCRNSVRKLQLTYCSVHFLTHDAAVEYL